MLHYAEMIALKTISSNTSNTKQILIYTRQNIHRYWPACSEDPISLRNVILLSLQTHNRLHCSNITAILNSRVEPLDLLMVCPFRLIDELAWRHTVIVTKYKRKRTWDVTVKKEGITETSYFVIMNIVAQMLLDILEGVLNGEISI